MQIQLRLELKCYGCKKEIVRVATLPLIPLYMCKCGKEMKINYVEISKDE